MIAFLRMIAFLQAEQAFLQAEQAREIARRAEVADGHSGHTVIPKCSFCDAIFQADSVFPW